MLNDKIINLENHLIKMMVIYRKNYNFSMDTYSKTGGVVALFVVPDTREKAVAVYRFCKQNNIEYKVIGEASNILFLDSVRYSVFVATKLLTAQSLRDGLLKVESGKILMTLASELAMRSYSGFEGLEGIPGTVGGAIVMNAGAYGFCISDNLLEVECVDPAGDLVTISNHQGKFGERDSIFRREKFDIISASFQMKRGVPKEIERRMQRFHYSRHLYLEYVYPNLGSIYALPTSDIYRFFYPKDLVRRIVYRVFRRFFSSRLFVWYRRSNPDNYLVNKYLTKDYQEIFGSNIASMKTINTFVNKSTNSLAILEYFYALRKYLPPSVVIENEILTSDIYDIVHEADYRQSLLIARLIHESNLSGDGR